MLKPGSTVALRSDSNKRGTVHKRKFMQDLYDVRWYDGTASWHTAEELILITDTGGRRSETGGV